MKILINCYACSPFKGSEPGMGWNFIQQISKYHELHIIVESKFENDLMEYFRDNPEENHNKHFYFIEKRRHRTLRKIWPPSYYWFYKKWQYEAYKKAIELDKKYSFDIIHQLNMVGYREPGYLWKLNKPFVWGPIGGFNITPWCMLPSMGMKGGVFYFMRNIINLWQMHTNERVKKAMNKARYLIAATENEAKTILRIYGRESQIISEVGFIGEKEYKQNSKYNTLKICWCGQFTPGKSLNLLIEASSIVKSKIELHIIGNGECEHKWKKLSSRYKNLNVKWYGWVERSKSIEIMKTCHLFCITSLSDLTSTVLLEALSYGLPVISLDHCGFSNVITNECGIKISIKSYKQVIKDLALAIDKIASNEDLRKKMSESAYKRSRKYDWNKKGLMIDSIYKEILK